jgi:parallel beta-helix repeat protein
MGTKSKSLALVLVTLFLISIVILPPATVKAQSKTIVVPDDYPKIQEAINQANAGDSVLVKSGNYTLYDYPFGLTINKSITLIGQNKQDTILAQHIYIYPPVEAAILVSADNVTISGFTVKSGPDSIVITGSNCKITDNNILGSFYNGLDINGSNSIISGNFIANNYQFGIQMTADNGIISDNYLSNNRFAGIMIHSSKNVTVNQNSIFDNGNNNPEELVRSTGGLILRSTGPFYVKENNITNNYGFGIQFGGGCNNATVSNNNIIGNQYGFCLRNYKLNPSGIESVGSGNRVFWNNIEDNNVSAFSERVFKSGLNESAGDIGNGTDVVSWDNGVVGNYWSDYNGYGTYVIDQNNVDNYPLTQQVDISSIPTTNQPNAVLILPIAATVVIIAVIVSLLFYTRHRKKSLKTN